MEKRKNHLEEIKEMYKFSELTEKINLSRLNYDPKIKNMGCGDTEINEMIDFLEKSWEQIDETS
jgi:hypothetical protein